MGDQPVIFPLTFLSGPDGDVNALTVPFEALVEALRFDKRPDEQGPEVLRRLCGGYAMGPIEIVVALRGERTLTVSAPGSPPLDLEPIGGLRFGVKDQPAITAEFELGDDGAVTRLVAQPLGISCQWKQASRSGNMYCVMGKKPFAMPRFCRTQKRYTSRETLRSGANTVIS